MLHTYLNNVILLAAYPFFILILTKKNDQQRDTMAFWAIKTEIPFFHAYPWYLWTFFLVSAQVTNTKETPPYHVRRVLQKHEKDCGYVSRNHLNLLRVFVLLFFWIGREYQGAVFNFQNKHPPISHLCGDAYMPSNSFGVLKTDKPLKSALENNCVTFAWIRSKTKKINDNFWKMSIYLIKLTVCVLRVCVCVNSLHLLHSFEMCAISG